MIKKEKTILCTATACVFNNQAGNCLREGHFVEIAVRDKRAQCTGFERKIKEVRQ